MSIVERARTWIARDPDPDTRAELEALIAERNVSALEERFSGKLEFGTAGLRGLLGAGPARMNRVTVSEATAGFCAWLKARVPEASARGICVGRDARPNSDVFARDVVEIAAGAGIPVFLFEHVVPTPVLAFALRRLNAAGGVMITASHNPRGYNGYKVYWENGAQIIPPNDIGIAHEIEVLAGRAPPPRLAMGEARREGLVRPIDSLSEDYVATIVGESRPDAPRAPIRIAYTALHGVAEHTLRQVMTRAGFDDVHSVAEQSQPDGSFPTVPFPNPEEPGAMDRVFELALEVGADLVLANDPDGDRLAAAVRTAEGFETLSGNDIGLLLAEDLLAQESTEEDRVVLSTVVSSPLLGAIATKHGARWEQTLTGHKWIQNRAIELERSGWRYVFGYEEALGYAPSRAVRDKDGISSALRLADMASRSKAAGKSLVDARSALWREHGFIAERQVSVRFEGTDATTRMRAAVDRIRRDPPTHLGGKVIERTVDLERQVAWTPTGEAPFTELGRSNVVIFELEGGHRAMLRPSGTEPKLKYYFYAVGSKAAAEDLEATQASTRALLEAMVRDLTGASDY